MNEAKNDIIGDLPEGWEWKALSDITEVIGGGTPKTEVKEYWNGDVVWLSPVDLPPIGEISGVSTSAKK
ncbi:MAG: restriction endonuclease subunit S [Segetibacter sp.]